MITNEPVSFTLNQATIQDVSLAIVAILTAYATWQSKRNGKDIAAVKVVADATHTLSTSTMGAQLQTGVDDAKAMQIILQRIAAMSNASGDIAAAKDAEERVKQRTKLL